MVDLPGKMNLPEETPVLNLEDAFENGKPTAALNNAMEESHQINEKRKKEDPEWTTKRWTFASEINSYLAHWAIRQSPFPCAFGLEPVVNALDKSLNENVEWEGTNSDRIAKLSLLDIQKLLYDALYEKDVKEFNAWNEPLINKGGEIAFVTRYSTSDPTHDFVDLNALLHNVCISIRNERREHDRFDARCEEEWAEEKKQREIPETHKQNERN